MSSVSQTPARRPLSFGARLAIGMGVAAAIVAAALGPFLRPMVEVALAARPHAPDLALFDHLSPAIKIHLLTALAALALGAVLMTVRKDRTFHRVAGWVWVCLVSVTAGATLFITSLNHGAWSLLHLFTGWVLLALPVAVIAAKRHQIQRHRKTMMGLFYGGFAINLLVAMMPGRTLWMMFLG